MSVYQLTDEELEAKKKYLESTEQNRIDELKKRVRAISGKPLTETKEQTPATPVAPAPKKIVQCATDDSWQGNKDYADFIAGKKPKVDECDKIEPIIEPAAHKVPAAPETITPAPTYSWRNITNADVEAILKKYPLGILVDELRKVSNPPLPLELALPNALAMVSCALSQDNTAVVPPIQNLNLEATGHDRLAVRININGTIQALNLYLLVAAPSGSGKDIGGNVERTMKDVGVFVISGGTREGVEKGICDNPNPLLRISEFKSYMDKKSYNHTLLNLLTTLFTKCETSDQYSQSKREVMFSAPTVLASVQPNILRDKYNSENVDDGFFGRLLVCILEEKDLVYWDLATGCNRALLKSEVEKYKKLRGELFVPCNQFKALDMELFNSPIRATTGRYCKELGHRLCVALTGTLTPSIQMWLDTGVLLRWFINNHERVAGNVGMSDSESYARKSERWKTLVLAAVRKCAEKGLPANKTNITREHNARTWGCNAKMRQMVLDELVEFGDLEQCGDAYKLPKLDH